VADLGEHAPVRSGKYWSRTDRFAQTYRVPVTETRKFALDGAHGLTGRLDTPDGKPRAVVLVAHCFGGGNEGPAAAAFARGFAERGMAVLSLECAAGGASGLDADDLVAAAGQLRAVLGAPGVLVGQARAAAAILAAADRISRGARRGHRGRARR